VLGAIPAEAHVAAPMQALAHLAERKRIFVLPEPMLPVRVGTRWSPAERARATRELEYAVSDAHMRPWGTTTAAEVAQLLERNGFREVLRRGDTALYRRERAS
jgi:hypothetical protein